MAFEIERKFLVKGDAWRGLAEPLRIRQGYVATKDGTTVRVRVVGGEAFLTLKDHAVGLVRHEFEYPIPVEDAETILDTMCGNLVEKNRYRIPAKEPGLVWEVDEYFGANAPLVTAEIELPDDKTVVELPDWIGLDVTNDHRYKNNNLAEHPYAEWRERPGTK
jgi:CYTH domain-containing protein